MKMTQPAARKILLLAIIMPGIYFFYKILVYFLISIHAFLALSRPVNADVLVVEGWIFEYMLDSAAKEIRKSNYKYIVTIGTRENYPGDSRYYGFESKADYCKAQLAVRGVDPSIIYALSSTPTKNNRTFHNASAIKSWLVERDIKAVNVYTGGPHGRKSLVLFQKALGKTIKVGVISCKIEHYDPVYWWTSWRGTLVTLRYFIGYLYALCFQF